MNYMKRQTQWIKRFGLLFAAIALAGWLSACSKQSESTPPEETPDQETPADSSEDSDSASAAGQTLAGAMEQAKETATEVATTASEMADEAIIKAQKATYPLKVCVVSGEELDSMGEGVNYVYKGRLVRFCCKDCIDDFTADPEKYLAKIDEAKNQ